MNMVEHKGAITGAGRKIALVVSRYNEAVTRQLQNGAESELRRLGVAAADVDVYEVPGAFELPCVADRVARQGRHDAVVCLGAVIRGATPHFDFVAAEAAKGVAQAASKAACPVVFGVLTCDTEEQARERAGGKSGNRGAECARAALELIDLYRQIG
jgi:6,7-dimethyl-8-ribityllumazine synthase